jgi:hypothetical protein
MVGQAMMSQEERDRMTISQKNRLAETRDCPHCAGTLERMDISKVDQTIVESYQHVGKDSCLGHNPSNGLIAESGTHIEHWADGKSVADGALRSEFE